MNFRNVALALMIVIGLSALTGMALAYTNWFLVSALPGEYATRSWLGLAAFLSMAALPFSIASLVFFILPSMFYARYRRWHFSRDAVILIIAFASMLAGLVLGRFVFQGLELWFPAVIGLANGCIGGTAWWFLVGRGVADRDMARMRDPDYDGD